MLNNDKTLVQQQLTANAIISYQMMDLIIIKKKICPFKIHRSLPFE